MKQKSPQQLQNSVTFYRWLSAILFIYSVCSTILVFSYDNVYSQSQNDLDVEEAKTKVLQEELAKERKDFEDALCLPRVKKFDKEMGLL